MKSTAMIKYGKVANENGMLYYAITANVWWFPADKYSPSMNGSQVIGAIFDNEQREGDAIHFIASAAVSTHETIPSEVIRVEGEVKEWCLGRVAGIDRGNIDPYIICQLKNNNLHFLQNLFNYR